MTDDKILTQLRDALLAEFGSDIDTDAAKAKARVERYTCHPLDDPGEWAPNAAAIVHAEHIDLPLPLEIPAIEAWQRVSDRLDGFYCEHVNNAVVAVYKEWR